MKRVLAYSGVRHWVFRRVLNRAQKQLNISGDAAAAMYLTGVMRVFGVKRSLELLQYMETHDEYKKLANWLYKPPPA